MFGFGKKKQVIKAKFLGIMTGISEGYGIDQSVNETIYDFYSEVFINNYNKVMSMPPELRFDSEYEAVKYAYQTTLCAIINFVISYEGHLSKGNVNDANFIKKKLLPRDVVMGHEQLVLALLAPARHFRASGDWTRHEDLEETAHIFLSSNGFIE